jgi:glycosyltransferase involved in cell wall biosynthesis
MEQNVCLNLIVVVLTFNEENHIARCIRSVEGLADEILVVDSYSSDSTCAIAQSMGARVVQREWTSHFEQLNWALDGLDLKYEWILRLDADEYLTGSLKTEIESKLRSIRKDVNGVFLRRSINFQGRLLRFGSVSRLPVLRIIRSGFGRCEERLMDERLLVEGATVIFERDLIDHNLNDLTWWIEKHNRYASSEALEELKLMRGESKIIKPQLRFSQKNRVEVKRLIREYCYLHLPFFARAALYFVYRYIFRGGFLDGKQGFIFHVLQGFWYRFIVDAKVLEALREDQN